MAIEERVVGVSGAKKIASCPATIEVLAQSSRTVPVRRRTMPNAAPFGVFGKPPAKSNFTLALVRAPAISGPKVSIPICDWRSDPEKDPATPGASAGTAIWGKSRLSTEPRVTAALRSTSPDRRTRYFEPLSTLVWLCSIILSFINSWSSSNLEIRCCKSPFKESSTDCTCGKLVEAPENHDDVTDADDACDIAGRHAS